MIEHRPDGRAPRGLSAATLHEWLARLAVIALAAVIMPAHADPILPNATPIGTVLLNLGGARQDSVSFGSIGVADPRIGTADFTATATPLPTLTASAAIGVGEALGQLFGRGAGFLTYYFEILGPAPSVDVLIDVAGAASASSIGHGSFAVAAMWELFESVAQTRVLASDEIRSGELSGAFDQSFSRTVSLNLATDHIYSIVLLADAAAAASDQASRAIADAFVDPRLHFATGIDPAFSFVLSSGIGNEAPPVTGTVSEPGTLALLGLAAFSWCGFRRRRTGGRNDA